MLILKAYVNHEEIDTVWIHNTGNHIDGIFEYEVIKPKGIKRRFFHKRNLGWKDLAQKVLKHLTDLELFGR